MKRKIFLATAAAFVLTALFAGIALAQAASDADRPNAPALFQAFLDKFAANLGMDSEKVTEALKQTQLQMIDEAVQQEKMTPDQAEKIKEKVQNDQWFCGPFFGPRHGRGGPDPEMLAQALGMSQDELQARLKEGKRIDEIAQEQGISVEQLQQKMKELRIEAIEQAVKDGKITREKADEMIQRIQNAPQGKGFRTFGPPAAEKTE
ncbi:MAG: DUF2680 domain-containing protein [Armatimonadetes bacterium]|nr:DUF2680 domain-containing protein [Armatimonadota bacterium]